MVRRERGTKIYKGREIFYFFFPWRANSVFFRERKRVVSVLLSRREERTELVGTTFAICFIRAVWCFFCFDESWVFSCTTTILKYQKRTSLYHALRRKWFNWYLELGSDRYDSKDLRFQLLKYQYYNTKIIIFKFNLKS